MICQVLCITVCTEKLQNRSKVCAYMTNVELCVCLSAQGNQLFQPPLCISLDLLYLLLAHHFIRWDCRRRYVIWMPMRLIHIPLAKKKSLPGFVWGCDIDVFLQYICIQKNAASFLSSLLAIQQAAKIDVKDGCRRDSYRFLQREWIDAVSSRAV